MFSEESIIEILRGCYDIGNPYGKPANPVELGCVASLQLTPDLDAPGAGIPGVPPRFQLALTLLPSSDNEDARAQLRAQILNALAGVEQLSRTHLQFDEGWTQARITPAGRKRLKLDPAPLPFSTIADEETSQSRPHPRACTRAGASL